MTRTILVVAAAALISFSPRHANASEAPWCAVYSGDQAGAWSCEYRSVEECRPNVLAGNRGWCNPNPYFVASDPSPERRRYTKRHARPQ